MLGLSKLASAPVVERRLVLQAAPVVGIVRLLLWVLPSPLILRWMSRLAVGGRDRTAPAVPIDTVIWAVEAVSRRIPRASCLTQAVAGQLLLHRHGYASKLCLGVARGAQGQFRAHAWLERRGVILIGGAESRLLTRLPDLADSSRSRARVNRPWFPT